MEYICVSSQDIAFKVEHTKVTKYCQAQPKVQTKASAFGWDGYNIIMIQPPTHPDKYEGHKIEQN